MDVRPAGLRERDEDAMKWWRWECCVGRWMPSEPPQGRVDATYWRMSETPPTNPGPLRGVDGRELPSQPSGDARLSSASSTG